MTIDEFIQKLRDYNTGAPMRVLIEGKPGEYWTPEWSPVRVNPNGEEPLREDDDFAFAMVLRPPMEA
jgi:hypothetical protein